MCNGKRTHPRSVLYLNLPPCLCSGNQSVSLTTAIAIYFIIWWTVLFAVLPFGVRSQQDSGAVTPGTDPGAPAMPRLWRKLIWTTIMASVVFALCVVVYANRLVTLDGLAALFGMAR
jgi:predicted secreted protein